ncbi:MAG TPA: addiction module protein [Desulfuromonadales bacterium]|nr:addiction module protein [Desulfuromonadales bacterium]
MQMDLKAFEAEAMTLPVSQRAIVAQHLLSSLDDIVEQENELLWLEEAGKRYDSYKAGALPARDAFEAIVDMRNRL